jgi:uncharacterized protein (TIGR02246 family)
MKCGIEGSALADGPDKADPLLQLLLDERACAHLIQRYGVLADGDDVESFVDLFTPDAIWQRADGATFRGHEQIRSVYTGRPASGFSCHLICNISVSLAGTQATVHSNAVVLKSSGMSMPCTTPPAIAMASYVDHLQRCEDGLWRIAQRSASMLLNLAST